MMDMLPCATGVLYSIEAATKEVRGLFSEGEEWPPIEWKDPNVILGAYNQLRPDRLEFSARRVIDRLQKSVKRLRLPARYQLEIKIEIEKIS